MPHCGMVLASWIKKSMPFVMMHVGPHAPEDSMAIIHSIVPYKPCTKARVTESVFVRSSYINRAVSWDQFCLSLP